MENPQFNDEPQDRLMKLLLQSGLAAVAGWLSVVIGFPLSLVLPRSADYLVISPTFLLPISAGMGLALLLNSRGKRTSHFTFVPLLLLPLSGYLELSRSPFRQHSPWIDLFGVGCGETECLYELIFVVPFISALAYSFASLMFRNRALKRTTGDTGLG